MPISEMHSNSAYGECAEDAFRAVLKTPPGFAARHFFMTLATTVEITY